MPNQNDGFAEASWSNLCMACKLFLFELYYSVIWNRLTNKRFYTLNKIHIHIKKNISVDGPNMMS